MTMYHPKLKKPGMVIIHPDGQVEIKDFEIENGQGCRSHAQVGMAWAAERLSAALLENLTSEEPNLSGIGIPSWVETV